MAKSAPPRTGKKSSKKSTTKSNRKPASAESSSLSSATAEIDKKIASLNDWRGATLAEVRSLIREVDPEVVEEWKWMGTPVWSHEGMYVLVNAHKDKVKITFFHGAKLADPKKIFNAGLDGNKWRAIDLAQGDKIDKKGFQELLRRAIAYNLEHAAPKSKGSRASLLSKNDAASPGVPEAKTAQGRAPSKPTSGKSRTSAKPKLLSGDNPQIAKGEGDEPVQAYIAAIPDWKQDVARRLDELIVRTVKDVKKAVKWNSPFYGMDGQGWFLSYHCFSKYVKVAFFRGAQLKPLPPGASKQEEVRYLDIRENDSIDEKTLASWIRQASKLPGMNPSPR
jgi:hypothetical protein